MKKSKFGFFKKHFVLTTVCAGAFVAICAMTMITVSFYFVDPVPSIVLTKFLEKFPENERQDVANKFSKAFEGHAQLRIHYYSNGKQAIESLKKLNVSKIPNLPGENGFVILSKSRAIPPPKANVLTRIGNEDNFLYFQIKPLKGGSTPKFMMMIIGLIALSVLFSTSVSAMLFYRYFSKFAADAGNVIRRIKEGDLNARFKIANVDEISDTRVKFNDMADQIQFLVEKIKTSEQSRTKVLQQLTHDLRTPIASLKNVLELLENKMNTMAEDRKNECFHMAIEETKYLERLVEDLLFLARASEPKYRKTFEGIDALRVIENQCRVTELSTDGAIKTNIRVLGQEQHVLGDPHLINRLIKNVLSNASTYAKSEIKVTLDYDSSEDELHIQVKDNGVGFSEEALATYGIRKFSRIQDKNHSGKVSIGLGSVIAATIVDLHQGTLNVSNDPKGEFGAIVDIFLPIKT